MQIASHRIAALIGLAGAIANSIAWSQTGSSGAIETPLSESAAVSDTERKKNVNRDTLEEIVVSAQRREEDLDKVPISITALSQNAMDELHIQKFSDLASIVPGLEVTPHAALAQNASEIAIRGIFSNGNAPTTAIYIDETPISIRELGASAGISGTFQPDIFDLERVEVLRGPQGTLFGSSAMGGAIRYITPAPNLENTSGYAKAEVASTDRGGMSYATGVAYGAPIVEGVAGFRVSGWFHSDGGFVDTEDPRTGQILDRNSNSFHAYTLRPAATIVPVAGLTVTPAVYIQNQYSDAPAEYWVNLLPYLESGAHASGALGPHTFDDRLTVPSLAIKYEFDGMSFQSDTSFLHRRFRSYDDPTAEIAELFNGTTYVPGLPPSYSIQAVNTGGTDAWTQEFRLVSADDVNSRWHWVLGAFYRHSRETLSQPATTLNPLTEALFGQTSEEVFGVPEYVLNGQSLSSYTNFSAIDEQRSLFGEESVDITTNLKVSAGVRIEHSVVEDQNQIVAGPFNGVAYREQLLPSQKANPITPRFSITYQFTDQNMVYVSAAKGYRDGGGNSQNALSTGSCEPSLRQLGLTEVPDSFKSDSLWAYELGTKDTMFNNRLSILASLFYIDWSDRQTGVYLPTCSLGFTANRGKAVSQGFDVHIAAMPFKGMTWSVNVGYTDAYFPNAAYWAAPPGGVAPLLNGAGDKLSSVIPWTASTQAEYARDIGFLWSDARAYLRADYRWLDAMPKGNPNVAGYDPEITGIGSAPDPAYGMLNLRLGVTRGGLDFSAFVNNVNNVDPTLSYAHPGPTPLFYATALRPRTAGVTALYRF